MANSETQAILDALQAALIGIGPDGEPRPLLLDGNGRLRVATGPPALFYKDNGSVTFRLISTNPCYVVRLLAINRNTAVRFFNIHDKATAPAATNIPTGQGFSMPIPGGTTNNPGVLSVELGETHRLDIGLGWSISTVENVFTDAATASEHSVHLWYTLLTPKD